MTPEESFEAGVTATPAHPTPAHPGAAGYLAGPPQAAPTAGPPAGEPAPPYQPPVTLFTSHHRRRSRAVPVAVGCAVAVLIAAPAIAFLAARAGSGTTGSAASPAPQTRLEKAKRECAQRSPHVSLGDEGTSMVISRVLAEEDPGATWNQLSCVFVKVDIPDAVVSHIEGTRALDGRQQASWDGFEASWTYHPDDGLNLILRETG